jgi:hypothetical protein
MFSIFPDEWVGEYPVTVRKTSESFPEDWFVFELFVGDVSIAKCEETVPARAFIKMIKDVTY